MLLDTDRDRNIDLLGKNVSIFCRTHTAVGHRIQGGRPGPLRLRSAAVCMYMFSPNVRHAISSWVVIETLRVEITTFLIPQLTVAVHSMKKNDS